jgi:hypothetical protein
MALTWHLLPRGGRGSDAFGDELLQVELACKQLEAHLRRRVDALVAQALLLERALLDQDPEDR